MYADTDRLGMILTIYLLTIPAHNPASAAHIEHTPHIYLTTQTAHNNVDTFQEYLPMCAGFSLCNTLKLLELFYL